MLTDLLKLSVSFKLLNLFHKIYVYYTIVHFIYFIFFLRRYSDD